MLHDITIVNSLYIHEMYQYVIAIASPIVWVAHQQQQLWLQDNMINGCKSHFSTLSPVL